MKPLYSLLEGQFSRVNFKVDLLIKPLILKFCLNHKVKRLEYEGLHIVCFHCVKYGNKQEHCLEIAKEKGTTSTGNSGETNNHNVDTNGDIRPEVLEDYRSRMISKYPIHRRKENQTQEAAKTSG